MNAIELRQIGKTYRSGTELVRVLKQLDLNVEEGEMIAIMGPSGSGKTTLLNILALLDPCDEGEYYLLGKNARACSESECAFYRNRMLGFVVQDFALIDRYTVYRNVELPLRYCKMTRKERERRVLEAVQSVGLSELLNRRPKELSGGQKQRVAIARAIVNDAKILLADEPTGALDEETTRDIMGLMETIRSNGRTIVIVTHDPMIASGCNRVLHLREGRLSSEPGAR